MTDRSDIRWANPHAMPDCFPWVRDVTRAARRAIGIFMTVHPSADFVREVVLRIFSQTGPQAVSLEGLTEMILISGGKYRGRSYRADGLLAMWLADLGLLQVYDRQGQMLRTVNLFEEQNGLQKAA